MNAEGNGFIASSTAGQLGPSAAEANLTSGTQSDLASRSVDIHTDVGDVVNEIVSCVAAADGTSAVTTSAPSSVFECQSTHDEHSATVSASVDDDVLLVEVQQNGYYCECYIQCTFVHNISV